VKPWRWFLASLVLLGIAVAAEVAGASDREPPPLVPIERLRADPLAYLGKEVRIVFQRCDELSSWNPYLTRFGSEEFQGFRAWADEQFLWLEEDWDEPDATLYVRRGGVPALELASAPRFARFEASAHVREVFAGRAWIEIASLRRLEGEIGEGTILHASRAVDSMREGRFRLALDDLDRALPGDMPDAAREELRRLRQMCERRERP
jgi:hypothetical protein